MGGSVSSISVGKRVGAHVVVGANVSLGANVLDGAHVVVGASVGPSSGGDVLLLFEDFFEDFFGGEEGFFFSAEVPFFLSGFFNGPPGCFGPFRIVLPY